jgi:hypothetical protein
MASMKAHTHLRWVLGSMAPLLDPPTAEHAGPCFGYTFKKCRHHIRCSGRPSWGRCSPWTMSFQTSSTTNRLVPKNSRNSLTEPHLRRPSTDATLRPVLDVPGDGPEVGQRLVANAIDDVDGGGVVLVVVHQMAGGGRRRGGEGGRRWRRCILL